MSEGREVKKRSGKTTMQPGSVSCVLKVFRFFMDKYFKGGETKTGPFLL